MTLNKLRVMKFICYPKCTTCQKARKWLDVHGVHYVIRDIKEDKPSYDELKTWLAVSGMPVRKLFNTSGLQYKSLNLKDKLLTMSEEECLKLLSTDAMLVKRPLLVDENFILVGFKEVEWEKAMKENN